MVTFMPGKKTDSQKTLAGRLKQAGETFEKHHAAFLGPFDTRHDTGCRVNLNDHSETKMRDIVAHRADPVSHAGTGTGVDRARRVTDRRDRGAPLVFFLPEYKRRLTPKGVVHVLVRCASLGPLLCGPEHHTDQKQSTHHIILPTLK